MLQMLNWNLPFLVLTSFEATLCYVMWVSPWYILVHKVNFALENLKYKVLTDWARHLYTLGSLCGDQFRWRLNVFVTIKQVNTALLLSQDFGDVIPGHGGIMDRFDCQYLMATFVNVYISSFIHTASPQKLLQQVCKHMLCFSHLTSGRRTVSFFCGSWAG